jgi:pimeloyl-ACP methyl ester carboxylesterase
MFHQNRCSPHRWPLLLGGLLLAFAGCRTPIGVQKVGYESVYRDLRANALDQGVPSDLTEDLLEFLDLTDAFAKDPEKALRTLHARAVQEGRRNIVFALAELHYLIAKRTESREHFLASAVYAYFYLFDEQDPVPPDPYSLQFRAACDIYNRALSQALLSDDLSSIVLAAGTRELPKGKIALETARLGFPWGDEMFSKLLPSDAYAIRGLSTRTRDAGLGVPVVAVPARPKNRSERAIHALTSDVPATVFLRLKGGLRELDEGTLAGTLELYSSFDYATVEIGKRTVPLEADLTTPLAHSLEGASIWSFDLAGLFSGGMQEFQPGIYMVQPYQPGKIPIVFVHGTSSSPTTWIEMFNWLRADRELRRHCQFWFFLYPSGSPIAYSGYLLRKALSDTVAELDPGGEDDQLRKMVVVGHSQGGLLTKLTAVDSGGAFWSKISDRPLDEIQMGEEQRQLVRSSLFFEHLPFVKRVVYIATPHQGSFLAGNWLGRIVSGFIEVPKSVQKVFAGVPDQPGLPKDLAAQIPTSIGNMTPGNRFIQALHGLEAVPEIHVHSIIAVQGDGPPEKLDDGLVTYQSAHIARAESECVVRSFHTCLGNVHVIDEMRRILLEHVAESGKAAPLPGESPLPRVGPPTSPNDLPPASSGAAVPRPDAPAPARPAPVHRAA